MSLGDHSGEIAAVVGVHLLFWSVVGARLAAERLQWVTRLAHDASADAIARPARSGRALSSMLFVAVTMCVFYVLLGMLLVRPRYVGPRLLPVSTWMQSGGLVLAIVGIALMGWSYSVLRSFRLLPVVDRGHQLCVSGPYRCVRHPVYLGVHIFYLGCFLLLPFPAFLVQAVMNVLAYDTRARIEEDVMERAFGGAYVRYARRTRRLLPGIY